MSEKNETTKAAVTTPAGNNTQEFFDDAGAAQYVGGIEERTVREWRTRRGLPFLRITAKTVRIRRVDLDKWMLRHSIAIVKGGAA